VRDHLRWPAAAARLEELLAYAGSRHPPKVHISLQTRTSRALASRYSGDAALVAAASVATTFGMLAGAALIAAALLHGANPYAMSFTGGPAGQTSDCFNYLPFTLLATLSGRIAFGDVRYAELLVLFAGVAMLLSGLSCGTAGATTPGGRRSASCWWAWPSACPAPCGSRSSHGTRPSSSAAPPPRRR
jgi:hypothetical protein